MSMQRDDRFLVEGVLRLLCRAQENGLERAGGLAAAFARFID